MTRRRRTAIRRGASDHQRADRPRLNRTPIHIALGLIALIWLAPTVGLLVTSFRPRSDIQVDRLVGELPPRSASRSRTTSEVLNAQGMLQAFINTFIIAVPSTLLPLTLGVDGGLRVLVAALPVPRRALPARRRAADGPGPGRVHPAADAVRADSG